MSRPIRRGYLVEFHGDFFAKYVLNLYVEHSLQFGYFLQFFRTY